MTHQLEIYHPLIMKSFWKDIIFWVVLVGVVVGLFYLLSLGWKLLKGVEWGEKKVEVRELVVEPVYGEVWDFKDGLACVKDNNLWGVCG